MGHKKLEVADLILVYQKASELKFDATQVYSLVAKQLIHKCREAGYSLQEIADIFGKHKSYIHRVLLDDKPVELDDKQQKIFATVWENVNSEAVLPKKVVPKLVTIEDVLPNRRKT